MKKLILCFQLFFAFAGAAKEDSIVVQLATDCRLLPLHMEDFEAAQSGFDHSYIKKLESVLSFDLDRNGMTYIPKRSAVKTASGDVNKYQKLCKDLGVYYYIKTQVKDKTLAIRIFSANNNQVKGIEGIALTGNIAQDRKTIHQVSDLIHKELFGKPGIADTHVLYTVKTKVQGKNEWESEVWEADYDGGNARQITKGGDYCLTPIYVPPLKGKACGSFCYVSYKTGQPKIYVGLLNDGVTQRLSYLRGNQLMPAISPQRNSVAFISDATGNPDLFIQPFSPEKGMLGKPQQIFASNLATQGTPTFNPEGTRLAFVSNKDGSPRIYVMDIPKAGVPLKHANAQLITKYSQESTAPAWSPDGNKIAYCSLTEGTRQIWIYDFDLQEEKQLTFGSGNKENPTWAPNSLHLIYNSSDTGASELFLINLNQPDAVKISSGAGEKRFPNWEARV